MDLSGNTWVLLVHEFVAGDSPVIAGKRGLGMPWWGQDAASHWAGKVVAKPD